LQILDEGRLTDGQGHTVDFRNTIVIMTSNIGSHRILDYKGQLRGAEEALMRATVMEELRAHFRPEFLNRVDEIIVFHALSEEQLMEIVQIQLARLRSRLAERRITLVLDDAAKRHLVKAGYDPNYGARPLKRTIQKEVETPLGRKILAGEINDGDTVNVGFNDIMGELTFGAGSLALSES
jgi:ATP-dependent Clp protease ATP-binding subunit ClpB